MKGKIAVLAVTKRGGHKYAKSLGFTKEQYLLVLRPEDTDFVDIRAVVISPAYMERAVKALDWGLSAAWFSMHTAVVTHDSPMG